MMSHCTASLKLTPWHEGTFASAVIYSPPACPLPFPPLVSNPFSLPSLSFLPQNDIHYFIVKQESFFSCSQGTKRKGKAQKMRHQQASSARLHGCNWSASLCDLGAPVETGSVQLCGSSNVANSLGKYSYMYEAQSTGSGRQERDCLSETL